MLNQTTTFLSGVDIYYSAAFLSIISVIITIFMFFLAILPYIKSKKEFSDLFIYRKVEQLQQSDFAIQQPTEKKADPEVYKERASDDAIKNSLENHENVLVIGMPKSGKTRSVYQALKAVIPDFYVIKVPPRELKQFHFPLLKRNYLVFFDDLNKFIGANVDFNSFLKDIKARSKKVIAVSTCRSGNEYIKVLNDEAEQFKDTFRTVVNLDEYELNESEGEKLAIDARVTWKPNQFLGTPGSVILDIVDMKNRYRNLKTYEKSILMACKLLKEANIFSYELVLIRAICTSIFGTKINEGDWINSKNSLEKNKFVTRSPPKIDVYDPILELVVDDYDPVDHLENLLSLLIGLEDAESLFYLGNAFYRDKKYENGEKSYNECLQISPKSTVAHYTLGLLLYEMGREEDAEVEYRKALSINPDYALAHNNLGLLFKKKGRKEDAEAEYRDALRINSDYALAHNNLGILLYEMGKEEDAEVEYRDALRINSDYALINPDYADAHNNLGNLLYEKGRKEDAEAEYRESLRINPYDAKTHYNLGLLLKEMGRKDDAEAEYRDALKINLDYAKVHANLCILYLETGKKEEAKKELEIAKRLFDEQGREADAKKTEELFKSLK
jgi:Flp pilus assembly protein TadD